MTQPVMAGSQRVPAEHLTEWAARALQAVDMPADDAGFEAELVRKRRSGLQGAAGG